MPSSTFLDIRQSVYRPAPVIIGAASINQNVNVLLGNIDTQLQKLFGDRNAIMTDGGILSLSANGQTLSFTQNARLVFNSTAVGGTPISVNLGSASVTFTATGYLWYAVADRVGGTATLFTVSGATGLPTATFANQEVFLLGVRLDSADGTKGVYLRGGTIIFAGQSVRIGGPSALDNYFSIANASDTTKQIVFSTGTAITGKTLTLQSSITNNRTITFPDTTDTLVTLNFAQTLTNKILSFLQTNVTTDATTTGSTATLQAADITVGVTRLTNGSLVSVSGIPAGASGQVLTIENQTGTAISILNDNAGATAANRIFTGTNGTVNVPSNATLVFTYDTTASRWMLTGGPTGSITTVGTYDSLSGVANGAQISGNSIFFQSASATVPGMVNITTQTFAGHKTFQNGATIPQLTTDTITLDSGIGNTIQDVNIGGTFVTQFSGAVAVNGHSSAVISGNSAGTLFNFFDPSFTLFPFPVGYGEYNSFRPLFMMLLVQTNATGNIIAVTASTGTFTITNNGGGDNHIVFPAAFDVQPFVLLTPQGNTAFAYRIESVTTTDFHFVSSGAQFFGFLIFGGG